MSNLTQTSLNLEAALRDFIYELKADFSSKEVPGFHLTVVASGRTDGDAKISFKLNPSAEGWDSEKNSSGGHLGGVVYETIRRLNYHKTNADLCLPNVKETYEYVKPADVSNAEPDFHQPEETSDA